MNFSLADKATASEQSAIDAAMQTYHEDIVRLAQHKKFMDSPTDKSLVQKTEAEVDQRLLAKGKYTGCVARQDLHQKVITLLEKSTPEDKANYVTVKINVGQFKALKDMPWINLPMRASIAEVYQLLHEVTHSPAESRGVKQAVVWKYQLLLPNQTQAMGKASIRLETSSDYRRMIEQTAKKGAKKVFAVLSRVGDSTGDFNLSNNEYFEAAIVKDTFPEVLDDDGTPFLEPFDWAVDSKEFLENMAAEVDETSGSQEKTSEAKGGASVKQTTHSHYTRASAK